MTTNSGQAPVNQNRPNFMDLDDLLKELAESGLSRFLRDKAIADRITRYVADETGVKLIYIRLVMQLLIPLVASLTETGGKWLGGLALVRLKSILERFEWCDKFLKTLKTLAEKTAREVNVENALKAYLKTLDIDQRVKGVEDLSLELRTALGTHELLAEMASDLKQDVVDLRELLTPFLNPQPLFKKVLNPDKESRFVYRSRFIPFVGRDEEMERLRHFLFSVENGKRNFCWQVITGPGGAGKSRLALELCEDNGGVFRAGILFDCEHNFHTWQPDMPALLVVDYASRDRARLKTMLRILANRAESFEYPVRVLLLDRNTVQQFLEELSADHDIRQHKYDNPWTLPKMGDAGLWDIMQHFFKETKFMPSGTQADHLARLREIDKEARPLFAAYYADALVKGRCGTQCDRMSLLHDIIKHEEDKYWHPAGVTDADMALLALATITRGITSLQTLPPEGITMVMDLIKDKKRFLALGGITAPGPQGGPQLVQLIPQWEPDLVGELFVLQFLTPDKATGENKWIDPLLKAAWELDPLATAMFITQAMQDYPDEPILEKLVHCPAGDLDVYLWTQLVVNLIDVYGRSSNMLKAQALYDDLAALAKANPGNAEISLEQARGAATLIYAYGRVGNIPKAQALYDNLAALDKANTGNTEIVPVHTPGAFNLVDFYGRAGDMTKNQALYDNLAVLDWLNTVNVKISVTQAQGAANLIYAYGTVGNIPEAQALYDDLVALAKANTGNAEIVVWRAKGALFLIYAYCTAGTAGGNSKVQALFDDVAILAQSNTRVAELINDITPFN